MEITAIKKKALCIGIRYAGHKYLPEISGAHKDAQHMAELLKGALFQLPQVPSRRPDVRLTVFLHPLGIDNNSDV